MIYSCDWAPGLVIDYYKSMWHAICTSIVSLFLGGLTWSLLPIAVREMGLCEPISLHPAVSVMMHTVMNSSIPGVRTHCRWEGYYCMSHDWVLCCGCLISGALWSTCALSVLCVGCVFAVARDWHLAWVPPDFGILCYYATGVLDCSLFQANLFTVSRVINIPQVWLSDCQSKLS